MKMEEKREHIADTISVGMEEGLFQMDSEVVSLLATKFLMGLLLNPKVNYAPNN